MTLLNFTLQDTLYMLFAILLFPSVLVIPGYVVGWSLDIFSFQRRTSLAQYVMAMALSNALMPILLFLVFRFASNRLGIVLLLMFFIWWSAIQIKQVKEHRLKLKITPGCKLALAIGSLWITFCILLLVDIQVGQRLYFNTASYDFTTRTALIEAITRTGIPPVNPTYYPGHFEKITELYYFWYILGSVVDTLGGKWVDARIALFAGITWTGLSLMATIATYLRVRNPQKSGPDVWRSVKAGVQLLAVSGLDFIPALAIMIAVKTATGVLPSDGRIEGWNIPIMSWLNALTWVPNHVAAMAACVIAMLAILSIDPAKKRRWAGLTLLAGTAIGSAFGLSTWVTFTFGAFMAVWGVSVLFEKRRNPIFPAIMAAGMLGLISAAPFLMDLLQAGGKSQVTGSLPMGLYVRPFTFLQALPAGTREIISTLVLPINYLFELGFFFVIAILWIRQKKRNGIDNSFWKAEILLLATVAILLSFVKSTMLAINDLGIRGWLLGQFILIVWAVDLFIVPPRDPFLLTPAAFRSPSRSKAINDLLTILFIVGIMTTALEALSTRFWPMLVDTGVTGIPNELTPDMNLGERTYHSRLAYDFIREHTPQDLVIQNNPATYLDRPSGLYGTRQMAIGDRTAYGVPRETFREMSAAIGRIFLARDATDWVFIDRVCSEYFIQAIVVNDTDPLWSSLKTLQVTRAPIYINQHYAVFRCGIGK